MASPSRIPQITVLGSVNMDLVSYVPHFPRPGETLTSTLFTESPGGKGANQAVACAHLSRSRQRPDADMTAHVRFVGAVGDDAYGGVLRASLARHGVDAGGDALAALAGAQTGRAVIWVDEGSGDNSIVLVPGANHALRPAGFADLAALGPRRPDLLVMQLEIPLETVLQAARVAKAAGVPVLLNPAPAVPMPDEVYGGLAHLIVNETEAAILSGCEEGDLDTSEGLDRVGRVFMDRGVQNLVITLGARGAFYMSSEGQKGLVPAEKAKVVDTTAAGDTFVGQYALETVSGFDVDIAVRKANRASAKTVERRGAQDSIPWRDELQ